METPKFSEDYANQSTKGWDAVFPFAAIPLKLSSLLAFIVGIAVFINSMNGKFVFDDTEAVVNNRDVLPESPLSNILANDFWGTAITHNRSHKSYRPVAIFTFRWNHWYAGGMDPTGFHIMNIFLHGLVSSLVVPVANNLFGGNAPRMSLLTSLLFAVHPVHTEAVAAVVGRADLLCALFSFLSLLTYAKATAVSSTKLKKGIYLLSSIFLCSLALFSKEQGITVLGICLAFDVLIVHKINIFSLPLWLISRVCSWHSESLELKFQQILPKTLNISHSKKENFQRLLRKWSIIRMSVLVFSGVLMMYGRWHLMGSTPPHFQEVDNPASFAGSFWTRVWTYNYLYFLNAWILLCPEWLSFDWSMGCVPLLSHFYDPRLVMVVLFWSFFGGLLKCGSFSADNNSGRAVNMAVAVAVISYLPASNLFFRVGFVLAERVLYLPSLGFCMLIILGLRNIILKRPHYKSVCMVAFGCILLLFCIRSVQRSNEWIEEYTLFQSALSICPLNAKVHYNVAKNAGDRGDRELAIKEYKVALQLHPQYDQAMNNLANVLREQGNFAEAESLLRNALKIRPDFAAAWMNLGIVLAGLKNHKEAELCYLKALSHRSHYPECYYNLGNLFLDLNWHGKALQAFKSAVKQRSTFANAWNNMVIMLESNGNLMEAKAVAYEALSVLPDDAGLHFNLANTLGKMSLFHAAEEHFKRAVELAPTSAVYHSNLGVLYHRWKKYDLAEAKYLDALQIDPQLRSAVNNLDMLRKSKAKPKVL